jgi:hypothetical protein
MNLLGSFRKVPEQWASIPKYRNGMETELTMTLRVTLLGFAFLFSLPLIAQESKDIIVMKNGDKFTCEIKSLNAGVLSIKLSYVDGAIGVQWSQIAHLESSRLFLVQTESGAVYTGKLSTMGASDDLPIRIQVAAAPKKEVEVPQRQIVSLSQTSESFWQRFDGAINTGILYSKGNESIQYNLSSQMEYQRERWSSQGSVNSTFASSSGSDFSTRNQIDFNTFKLLRWNNWFYAGSTSFLQSSVQEINLQTTLGGGVGRYIKRNNQASIYVLGGFAWQNAAYKQHTPDQGTQNTAVGFLTTQIKAFKFKKTNVDLTATVLPAISEPGRVHFNANAAYYIKVGSDLSWNFSFYGSWDNRPPATLSGSDYGTSSGLSWTFGNR